MLLTVDTLKYKHVRSWNDKTLLPVNDQADILGVMFIFVDFAVSWFTSGASSLSTVAVLQLHF